jgi:hypothetical protein
MNILLWHVHGSWTTAFVSGKHTYIMPVDDQRSLNGRGQTQSRQWPKSVIERTPQELAHTPIDLVLLQRPQEFELCRKWLRKQPGEDIPAIYLEHTVPEGMIDEMQHPVKNQPVTLVHVTHFNAEFWDSGITPTRVIEHGIVDPGYRYTGEIPAGTVVSNEMLQRKRIAGADIFERFRREMRTELFGREAAHYGGYEHMHQDLLHTSIAQRRFYLHTPRWTSLDMSLIEAMHLGMPIVAFASTEVREAVPPDCGITSTNVSTLLHGGQCLLDNPGRAFEYGQNARAYARKRYGVERFLNEWESAFREAMR